MYGFLYRCVKHESHPMNHDFKVEFNYSWLAPPVDDYLKVAGKKIEDLIHNRLQEEWDAEQQAALERKGLPETESLWWKKNKQKKLKREKACRKLKASGKKIKHISACPKDKWLTFYQSMLKFETYWKSTWQVHDDDDDDDDDDDAQVWDQLRVYMAGAWPNRETIDTFWDIQQLPPFYGSNGNEWEGSLIIQFFCLC